MKQEIRKKTEHMGVLVIRSVSKEVARELIIKGHYSHKWLATFGIHNFGVFREGAEAELRAEEPQASASGRDLMRDCLSILRACGIDPLRAGRNNRVAYVSYQWPLE